jgi:uncharacterized repeat protein (TIGR03803 family)
MRAFGAAIAVVVSSLVAADAAVPPIGTVFAYTIATGKERVVHAFAQTPDGNPMHPGATIDVGGTLYGTTMWAGPDGCTDCRGGAVIAMTPNGTLRILHYFAGSYYGTPGDGSLPNSGLVLLDGVLYGTTRLGGTTVADGAIFSVTPAGVEHVLHSFSDAGPDGNAPLAGLTVANGTLYGTTSTGGVDKGGTAFSITPDGKERVIHSFGASGDGATPSAAMIFLDGTLYGTTAAGGIGFGTVFSLTPSGSERVLHRFGDGNDGRNPASPLTPLGGALYGTTPDGGSVRCEKGGTVFRVTLAGDEEVLHAFGRASDGVEPLAGLASAGGRLYGTTKYGGMYGKASGGLGTLFEITTDGTERLLHNFGQGVDGAAPDAELTLVRDVLYGTTSEGGNASPPDPTYALDPDATTSKPCAGLWYTDTTTLRSVNAVIRMPTTSGGGRSPHNAQLTYTVEGRSAYALMADADPSVAYNNIKLIDANGSDYPLLEVTGSTCGRECSDEQWFYSFESAGPSLRLLPEVTPAQAKPLGPCPQLLHSYTVTRETDESTSETRYFAGELPSGKFALVVDWQALGTATPLPTCRPSS